MRHLFDLDGGELEPANGNTKIEMIPFLVMRIAEIFSNLKELRPKNKEFVYCIQFNPDYVDTVKVMLMNIIHEGLPEGTTFYECDSKRIFELRGAAGGVTYAMCFYLITKGRTT